MAIISTLNAMENGYSGDAYPVASIPLSKLSAWEGNVRKTGATDGLGELIASISAHGILQSLVVRNTSRGEYEIVAGCRRFLALSALAESGTLTEDAAIPCRVIPDSADAAEISLAENVVRAPMHPADQFEAFRDLIDGGSTPADIAARFGFNETAVKQRLKLGRVSPVVLQAYRADELTLDQVQAFAISDDHAAQERVLGDIAPWNADPADVRAALTQDEIAATDKRARLVTVAAYEEAGGAVRRDLFAEGDDGTFILDSVLLDHMVLEKLHSTVEAVRVEGWKWVEVHPEFDFEARSQFRRRHPESLPLSDEAAAEHARLAEEYRSLFDGMEDDNEEASERLDEIEARINELEETERAFTPETLAIAGAIVTICHNGDIEIVRGLVRPEDRPETGITSTGLPKEKPAFSASLVESLTAQKSAAISASLAKRPDIALAAVAHALASDVFRLRGSGSSLQISPRITNLRETCKGTDVLEQAHDNWNERIPSEPRQMWEWCLAQEKDTLLELLAFCAARTVDAVQRKYDRPECARIAHANALAAALSLDISEWFTPTAGNFFNRISRTEILASIARAKGTAAKRSWDKLKKAELAAIADREVAGTGWLPQPLKA